MESDGHQLRQACLIGGEGVAGEAAITVANPSTGYLVGQVPNLEAAGIRHAVGFTRGAQQESLIDMAAIARGEDHLEINCMCTGGLSA